MKYDLAMSASVEIPEDSAPLYAWDGRIVGFSLPDGTEIMPQLIIKHYDPQTDEYRDLTYTEALEHYGVDADVVHREFVEKAP